MLKPHQMTNEELLNEAMNYGCDYCRELVKRVERGEYESTDADELQGQIDELREEKGGLEDELSAEQGRVIELEGELRECENEINRLRGEQS
jgi:chromosome segregation ATPase